MNAREIAIALCVICTGKHKDGREYLDDYLDTWAFLYSDENPTWEEVEKELEILKRDTCIK